MVFGIRLTDNNCILYMLIEQMGELEKISADSFYGHRWKTNLNTMNITMRAWHGVNFGIKKSISQFTHQQ